MTTLHTLALDQMLAALSNSSTGVNSELANRPHVKRFYKYPAPLTTGWHTEQEAYPFIVCQVRTDSELQPIRAKASGYADLDLTFEVLTCLAPAPLQEAEAMALVEVDQDEYIFAIDRVLWANNTLGGTIAGFKGERQYGIGRVAFYNQIYWGSLYVATAHYSYQRTMTP